MREVENTQDFENVFSDVLQNAAMDLKLILIKPHFSSSSSLLCKNKYCRCKIIHIGTQILVCIFNLMHLYHMLSSIWHKYYWYYKYKYELLLLLLSKYSGWKFNSLWVQSSNSNCFILSVINKRNSCSILLTDNIQWYIGSWARNTGEY